MKENMEFERSDLYVDRDIQIDDENRQHIVAYLEMLFDVNKKFKLQLDSSAGEWLNMYGIYNPLSEFLTVECVISKDDIITPLHLVWNGDYYYMVGVYDYKQRLGNFRIDRIAKCPTILDEDGTPPPEGFNIDDFINTTFRMYNSNHAEVELVCDNSVMDSIIDRFGEDVTTYANDMTSFRAVVNVAVNHVFYSWVFGFGGKVKIKSPVEVKEKYKQMLIAAMNED